MMGCYSRERIAVVMMAYKAIISPAEVVSILQCCRILRHYKFVLVAPQSVNLDAYIRIINDTVTIEVKRFDDAFFLSTKTYNKLMLDKGFYQAFSEYDYILIHQLDAFVFQDTLMDFVATGYDYIGAPWLDGMRCPSGKVSGQERNDPCDPDESANNCIRVYVGNGGLSLRRVQAFLELLTADAENVNAWHLNEDVYYAVQGVCNASFKVADTETALRFSFELDPLRSYELNGFKLPFGCHAWERYDRAFWREHMKEFGWDI